MSRVYEALQQMEKERGGPETTSLSPQLELLSESIAQETDFVPVTSLTLRVKPSRRLVALSEPRSLGAEKFRALATRLENLRQQNDLKSLQVTSSVIDEGKTLVAVNLAITLSARTRSRVLLLEGDLHRPSITNLLGCSGSKGLSSWWSERDQDVSRFLYRLNELPLWFLSAGDGYEQPSDILHSARFSETFNRLNNWFDWIVVDSTPMLPVADVNLWSRLVGGTVLVVREGVASVKALRKGLASLDNLRLVGTVLNDASEFEQAGYADQYYGGPRDTDQKESR